jgi:hypothetical protein
MRRHMATPVLWTAAHLTVMTHDSVSGGWTAWMPAKRLPPATAERPAHRMRFEGVVFIVLSCFVTAAG